MVASVRMLGYGGSRQPLIMADFREAKKNLHREWALLSEAWGQASMDRASSPELLAWRGHRNVGEGPGPRSAQGRWDNDVAGSVLIQW